MKTQKITPHLWFDTEAKEAAEFYTSAFETSKMLDVTTLRDTPSGDSESVTFELAGQRFKAISAGPVFEFSPAVSFVVGCESAEEVDALWETLGEGGTVMMPLDTYPFSERFGWTTDRYGVSWQIMHVGDAPVAQKITPSLLFVGDVCGKTEEAIEFYTSVFDDSELEHISRYEAGEEPDQEGTVKHAGFTLAGYHLAAMDSAHEHAFAFNEAISLVVDCDTQDEIDYYWDRLSAVPEAEQCGWLKDKYGVSWQIVPTVMNEMMTSGDDEQLARVTQAFLKMKKFDIAALEAAYKG